MIKLYKLSFFFILALAFVSGVLALNGSSPSVDNNITLFLKMNNDSIKGEN